MSRGKLSRLEKVKLLEESRTDRSEHKSKAAKKKERKNEEGKSTTNKEKARKKNFLMTLGKAKRKGKRSLVETKKVLKMHQERAKRGGKRGNR
jgi:protein SDA1